MKEFYPNMVISPEDAPFVRKADAMAEIAARDARVAELEADRRVLQSTGEHPAPCARHCEANAFRIELRNKDGRIAELEAELASRPLTMAAAQKLYDRTRVQAERIAEENKRIVDLLEDVALRNTRITELEKQAAVDKALLALADARINRELRDDFAGRAMQGILSAGTEMDQFAIARCSQELANAMMMAKAQREKGGA